MPFVARKSEVGPHLFQAKESYFAYPGLPARQASHGTTILSNDFSSHKYYLTIPLQKAGFFLLFLLPCAEQNSVSMRK
jgi:hypothetical protein